MFSEDKTPRRALIIELAHGTQVLRRFAFDRDLIRIGRDPKNDVILPSGSISRVHCKIERNKEGFLLVDNGSTNGLLLNGRRTKWTQLENGDCIEIGAFRLWISFASTEEDNPFPVPEDGTSPTLRAPE